MVQIIQNYHFKLYNLYKTTMLNVTTYTKLSF